MLKVKDADFRRAFLRGFFNIGDVVYSPESEPDWNITQEARQMLQQAWRDVGDSIRHAMNEMDALPEYSKHARKR